MVSTRDRILKLKEYLTSLGISVNIGKNKARGHNGFFMHSFDNYRIDVAKNLSEDSVISTILHEYAHYIHYCYDKSLKSLEFIFGDMNDDLKEELIKVTVNGVSKEFASKIIARKESVADELKNLSNKMKQIQPEFKLSEKNTKIEKNIKGALKYLLKYDKVKYFDNIYSVDDVDNYSIGDIEKLYIQIKSKQRLLKRINSKISKINKYYNQPSELFARFIDSYYTQPELTKKIAPIAYNIIKNTNIKQIENITEIMC